MMNEIPTKYPWQQRRGHIRAALIISHSFKMNHTPSPSTYLRPEHFSGTLVQLKSRLILHLYWHLLAKSLYQDTSELHCVGKDKQIIEDKGFSGFFPHSQWLASPTHTETETQGFGDLTSSQDRKEEWNGNQGNDFQSQEKLGLSSISTLSLHLILVGKVRCSNLLSYW